MAELSLHRWDDMPREELSDSIGRRLISGDQAMIAHVYLKQGALEFSFDDRDTIVVRAGEVLLIPGGLPHAALALEDTLDVDVFCPPREDWLAKTDDYLRG